MQLLSSWNHNAELTNTSCNWLYICQNLLRVNKNDCTEFQAVLWVYFKSSAPANKEEKIWGCSATTVTWQFRGWWCRSGLAFMLWPNSQQACIYVFMHTFLHVAFYPPMYLYECIHPAISVIQSGRERTRWPSPISHGLCFLFCPHPWPTQGLAGGHPTRPVPSLSSMCLSLSLTPLPPQRLDRKALRQLPTITSQP